MVSNYQVVYLVNDDERIIFAGKTHLPVDELLSTLTLRVSDDLYSLPIENFIYQPIKENQNETQTQK